jgi:replicative DNA helicase
MGVVDLAFQRATEAEENLIKGVLDLRAELDTPNHVSALDSEAFLERSHRLIWAALQAITTGGGLIDSWVVEKVMRKLGGSEADRQICERYFHDASRGTTADLRPRIASVAEAYKRRMLANGMAKLAERAITEDLKAIESEFAEISAKMAQAGNPRLRSGTDYAKQFEAFLGGQPILPLDSRENLMVTGSNGIDSAIVANPGRLIVIGGLPSAGKTALAVQAAVRTSIAGRRVALGSLEMDEDEISARIVACACSVSSSKALRYGGSPAREDRGILESIRRNLVGIHGCAGDSWTSLEAAIIREHRRAPLSLAILDYLQLMEAPDLKKRMDSEAQRIGEITKAAKRLAQRLHINVLILSQFNREVKETEEPTLQNFLGSGQIERDIDIALLLWNTEKNPQPGQDRFVNCRIAKNRGGERYGKVRLRFKPSFNQFIDDERESDTYAPVERGCMLGA